MPAKEDHDFLSKFATEFLGLDGDDLDNFVTEAMTRRGHKPVRSWTDSDGKTQGKTGFPGLGGGGKSGNTGSNWQY